MTQQRWRYFAWLSITFMCIIYAPMACEYMFRFFDFGSLHLWDRFFAMIVGERQALGPGSVFVSQYEIYTRSRLPLLVHTSLGGITILLGALQFARRLRQNYPKVHRWVGRILVGLATISMISAVTYLLRTGPAGTFSGPAFYVQLWGLAIFTLTSVLAGLLAIRVREIELHSCLMAYAFAMLLTAPLLRVLWLVLGLTWPDVTQDFLNIAGGTILGVFAPVGAIVASRVLDSSFKFPARHRPMPGIWLETAIVALALVTSAWLTVRYEQQIGNIDRLSVTLILAVSVALASFSMLSVRAKKRANVLAAEEWRIHALALASAPPLYLLMWTGYARFITPKESFYAAALTTPAVVMSAGLALVLWRRWDDKRAHRTQYR